MISKEEIPNTCRLLYRVHKKDIQDNKVVPEAFRERGEGEKRSMSTDWGKYSTPQESRMRAKIPINNAIVSFNVGEVRNIPLEVTHNPDLERNNPAHTDVKGIDINKDKARLELRRIYKWVIDIRENL